MKRHIAVIGAAVLGFLNAVNAQNNVTLTVGYPEYSTPPYYGLWMDTGISVTNGEWISVNAAGFWSPGTFYCYPDGNFNLSTDLFLGNGIQAGLITYIGSNPFQGNWGNSRFFPQDTGYWELGTSGQFMSNTNGELWLGINDDAVTEATFDNAGQTVATIFTGFTTNASIGGPTLSITEVSSNQFTFSISNGIPYTYSAIYDSADLTHWTLIDAVQLDDTGSYNNYLNTTGVPYRFYKLSNGQFWSRTIGFVRLLIGPGTTNYPGTSSAIANQLDAPNGNTLNGLFDPMPDGTYLPAGTEIIKWGGSAYNYYTWNGSGWGGNGSVTLNPGEGAFLVNPSSNSIPITFVGLVREGSLTLSLTGGQSFIGSMLPKAGYLQTALGYNPNRGDTVFLWNGSSWSSYLYFRQLNSWTPNEPVLNVGEGFFIKPSTNNVWRENYSSRQF